MSKIEVHNTAFQSRIAMIQANPEMLENFQVASNYLTNIVELQKPALACRNIKLAQSDRTPKNPRGGRGPGKGKGKGKPNIEARAYTLEEWNKFSLEEKKRIKALRQKQAQKRKAAAIKKEDNEENVPAGTSMSRKRGRQD